jgi:hypothetical protein
VALENRRFDAVKLFAKDFNNSEIDRRLKVSNQTVSRWRKEHQEGRQLTKADIFGPIAELALNLSDTGTHFYKTAMREET